MKKIVLIAFLLLTSVGFSSNLNAQSGNGNGQSQVQGQMPMQTVVQILKVAKDQFGVSLGTLVSGYCSGSCKIEKVGVTSQGDGLYKVEYGGGLVVIAIEGGSH